MSTPVNVAVIYYSSTGTIARIARAIAEDAERAGARVRLRRAAELAPQAAIDSNPASAENVRATADIPEVSPDDMVWADAVVFGSPTRYGNVAAQLKQFIDTLGGLWQSGQLADKVYSGFTASSTAHGGQESTLLALYNTVHHFGGILVARHRPVEVRRRQPVRHLARVRAGRHPGRRADADRRPRAGRAGRADHPGAQGRPGVGRLTRVRRARKPNLYEAPLYAGAVRHPRTPPPYRRHLRTDATCVPTPPRIPAAPRRTPPSPAQRRVPHHAAPPRCPPGTGAPSDERRRLALNPSTR
ncbi:NAD(P)H dehydrogenase (quinone) [Streptomyces californicus]